HANPLPWLNTGFKKKMSEEHAVHHQRPYDFSIILISCKGAIATALLVFLVVYFVSGSLDLALGITLIHTTYSMILEASHLVFHGDITHKTAFIKNLVCLHGCRHQCDLDSSFGVTSSLRDRIFGTYSTLDNKES